MVNSAEMIKAWAHCHPCGKRGFTFKADARKARRQMRTQYPGHVLNVYKCPVGSLWHVGHRSLYTGRGDDVTGKAKV